MDSSEEERIDRNQLHRSQNPYLLQHAQNPVWWQEWSRQILDIAKGLKRPLFISIGYSTCHWCHVMEEESFSNPEIADMINRYFISIKVDREDRPDLDTYYMNAANLMGVAGGWPLNVFADSEGIPFWICTYAPPEPRHGITSIRDILSALGETWEKSPEKIMSQTAKNFEFMKGFFADEIKSNDNKKTSDDDLKNDYFMKQQEFIDDHVKYFDALNGGFKFQARIKFPNLMGIAHLIELAIDELHRDKRQAMKLARVVLKSVIALIRGGIFDQLGGGLFRYSIDYRWKVPHFEKMLYDNALFIEIITDACRFIREISEFPFIKAETKNEWKKILIELNSELDGGSQNVKESISTEKNEVTPLQLFEEMRNGLEKTLRYWNQEMTVTFEGYRVFYAAQDAGDKENEGSYYSWTQTEISAILTHEELNIFNLYYDLFPFSRDKGTFLLSRKNRQLMHSAHLNEIDKKLFACRVKREAPFKDRKILLSWNAMMACSYIHVYETFGNEYCREQALETVRFLEKKMVENGLVLHSLMVDELNGKISSSSILGFLGDYAHLVRTLLLTYRITGDEKYLNSCEEHCHTILKYFYRDGIFSEVNSQHHDNPLPVLIEAHDGVEPGSQSLLAEIFLQLDFLYPNKGYDKYAMKIFRQFYESIGKIGLPYMTRIFYHYQKNRPSLSLYGQGESYDTLRKVIGSRYLPSLIFHNPKKGPEKFWYSKSDISKTQSKKNGKKSYAVICHHHHCSPPLSNLEEIIGYFHRGYNEADE